jgi:hypothetical protein
MLFAVSLVPAKTLGTVTEVLKPEGIEVSGDRLYVVEGATFFVFSLKHLELITKFGNKGEGPGELTIVPMIPNRIKVLNDGRLMAEGFNKVMFFSKDFKLLKEIKKKGMMYQVTPIGENFLAIRLVIIPNKFIFTLALHDPDMNVIKELYQQESVDRRREIIMLRDTIHFAVYKNKVYVEESTKGFFIEVFDSKGNKLAEINQKFPVQKITAKDKEEIFEYLKEDQAIQTTAKRLGGWENFEKLATFTYPDTFPVIKDIIVANDKIFVSTYERKDNKEKYVIMDLKGTIISTPFLSISEQSSFSARSLGRENRFHGIVNNKYYNLVENEDSEEWEAYVEEIEIK